MEIRTIERLPDEVVDQIAAGEVVERPASVVKELCENALDAGATRIAIEADGGGKVRIRVIDDGAGMTAAEARKAFLRHATSKLRRLDDLVGIATMGFRGEALAAIASVSRVTLVTRARAGDAPGVRLELEGGRIVEEAEVGAPFGTSIEVRDLLWNVPARQKFMKGEATEGAHLGEVVGRLAMAHPGVAVKLRQRGRTSLDAPACGDPVERVGALLGARPAETLVRAHEREGGVRVDAYLAAPSASQSTARGMTLFVGRRAVRDRGLAHAVLQGYGERLPAGRYPVAAVFVEVDGALVDVNVHPQKLEVRFADPQAVYAAVRQVVRRAIADAPWPEVDAAAVRLEGFAQAAPPPRASAMVAEYARERARAAFGWAGRRRDDEPGGEQVELGGGTFRRIAAWSGTPAPPRPTAGDAAAIEPSRATPREVPAVGSGPVAGYFGGLRFLGQLERTYLVCEGAGELVLIDQHVAHERVALARLRARYAERDVARQRLLFPQTLDVAAGEAAVAAEIGEALGRLGYEVEAMGAEGGRRTLAVRSIPTELRTGEDPLAVLRALLAEVAGGGVRAVDERIDLVLATIACHSVVRAGDALGAAEVEELFAALDLVDFRGPNPHGRPLLLRMGVADVARRFGR